MFTMYKTVKGDTFDTVARKVYGLETSAALVRQANPGTVEPLAPGTELITPSVPEDATALQFDAATADECTLYIDGMRFRYWTSLSFSRAVDSIDTVEFVSPFDPNDPMQRKFFKPFGFQEVQFWVGNEKIFTGTSLGPSPVVDQDGATVSIRAYAKCGVLQDCCLPVSALPFEFDGLNFKQIADKVTGIFGLRCEFIGDPGSAYEDDGKVTAQPGDFALEFLATLAKQKNFVLGSNAAGDLVARQFISRAKVKAVKTDDFLTIETGKAVARLVQGQPPTLTVAARFDAQQFYSHITALEYADVETGGESYTAKNGLCPVLRPFNFAVEDAEDANVKEAARAKMGRMFANMCGYSASVATWRDEAGKLWAPGAVVTLSAPSAMVYKPTPLVVRSVTFDRDSTNQQATLELILAASFTGDIPEGLPWGL